MIHINIMANGHTITLQFEIYNLHFALAAAGCSWLPRNY